MCSDWMVRRGSHVVKGSTVAALSKALNTKSITDLSGARINSQGDYCICGVNMDRLAERAGLRCIPPTWEDGAPIWDTWILTDEPEDVAR